jgi:hypothetical protein
MAPGEGPGKGGLGSGLVLVPLAAVVVVLTAGGCGGTENRNSSPRPPSVIEISVTIEDDKISADPSRFGAGPILLLASNQSSASHSLTIDGPRVKQSVGPINPRDTASLKVTVSPGEYTVAADGAAATKPARLRVGPERQSAQNELLQP